MGEIEIGKCEICGKRDKVLFREYYYYNIDCECCSGRQHFEIVRHCSNCIPEPPNTIHVHMKPAESRIG